MNILSIDWLRANAKVAHFFGLGFVQIKLTDTTRVHFYHEDIPAFVEEPHDHRYDFVSNVVLGALLNKVWKLAPGEDHEVSYETCRSSEPAPPILQTRTGLVQLGSFVTRAGSGYHMNADTFHTVEPLYQFGPVVTYVERELPFKEHARSVRKVGAPVVCPFSQPMPDDELWEIVRECCA